MRPAWRRGGSPGAAKVICKPIRHAVKPCVVGSWRRDGAVTRSGANRGVTVVTERQATGERGCPVSHPEHGDTPSIEPEELAARLELETDTVQAAFVRLEQDGLLIRTRTGFSLTDLKEREINRLYRKRTDSLPEDAIANSAANIRPPPLRCARGCRGSFP